MKKIGVLASHRGTNFQAILDACANKQLPAEVVVAISNNSRSEALNRAKRSNIPTHHLSNVTHPSDEDLDLAIYNALQSADVDIVVTAGYMKKLGSRTISGFEGRIVNVHPSLLPRYGGHGMYGDRVHQAVLDNGDTETGLTVHLVDQNYDTGRVINQQIVPVSPDDTVATLGARVLAEEHKLLVSTLAELLSTP